MTYMEFHINELIVFFNVLLIVAVISKIAIRNPLNEFVYAFSVFFSLFLPNKT